MGISAHPALLLFITITVYWIANILRVRTGSFLFNPVVLSSAVVILYLKISGIDYATYHQAGQFIDFWLKPAVVSLAVPLYLNWKKISSQWLPIVIAQVVGSITGILTGVYIAKWLGAEREVVLSLAAKSATNPIAIEVTRTIGGIPAITAAAVILAGMTGQMVGFRLMSVGTVRMPTSQGISMGAASHAMGIAAALERSRQLAAYASLGLIFNGVLTAVLVPVFIPLVGV